jgi:hypothetical protein
MGGIMRYRVLAAAMVAVLALAVAACGEDDGAEETGMDEDTVHVADAWARSPSEDVGAVYFKAHNGAEEEDRLIGVSSPVAGRAEIHETVEQDGEMVMQPVGSVAIGPDEEVSFEPGGYHIMLFDLTEPLEVDSTITVVLEFENAGQIPIEAIVEPYVPEGGMDMEGEGESTTGATGMGD